MKSILNTMKNPNIETGYLYFYVHFVTEVLCFYILSHTVGDSLVLWMMPFIYDTFAFVPQSLIGYFVDKNPKVNIGLIGVILLIIGFILCNINIGFGLYINIVILCLGNGCIHVSGAETTLKTSDGKLASSAIFVGGGSFGVITGKLLAKSSISFWLLAILGLTMIPFILLADTYKNNIKKELLTCNHYNYHNKNIRAGYIILFAVFVVIVRGYMGYGIPTSWNKTVLQTILLYISMGIGKALGGILSDTFGMRKIAIISVIGSLPFLLFGDNIMIISLIGITLFSMTMSITLGLLVSVLKKTPGLAFGLTTIGLFLGTAPIFFIKIMTIFANSIIIVISTLLCLLILYIIIDRGDGDRTYKDNI